MPRQINKPKINPDTGKSRATTTTERAIRKTTRKTQELKNFKWKFEREDHGQRANVMVIVPGNPSACVWGKFYLKHKSPEAALKHWLQLSVKHGTIPERFPSPLAYAAYKNSRQVYMRRPLPYSDETYNPNTMASKIIGMVKRKDRYNHIVLCETFGENTFEGDQAAATLRDWLGAEDWVHWYPQLTNIPGKPYPIDKVRKDRSNIDLAWANMGAFLHSLPWPHPEREPAVRDAPFTGNLWGQDETYRCL